MSATRLVTLSFAGQLGTHCNNARDSHASYSPSGHGCRSHRMDTRCSHEHDTTLTAIGSHVCHCQPQKLWSDRQRSDGV